MAMQEPVVAHFFSPDGKFGKWWYDNLPSWAPLNGQTFWGQSEVDNDIRRTIRSDVEGNQCDILFNNPIIGYPSAQIITGDQKQFHRFYQDEEFTFHGIIGSNVKVKRENDANNLKVFSVWLE